MPPLSLTTEEMDLLLALAAINGNEINFCTKVPPSSRRRRLAIEGSLSIASICRFMD